MGGLRPVAFATVCAHAAIGAILVVFLLGSLLLSGAQVTSSGAPRWEPSIAFPVFPVPAWLLIALAVAGLAGGLVWSITSRPTEARALTGAVGPAVAATVSAGFFLFAFSGDGTAAGLYGVAVVLSAASVLVILASSLIQGARHDRGARVTESPEASS